ncbi:hypothetical protein WJX74_008552 [Apatococcus lobatus]|uniref:TLDc domain-containing protein n=1 Tax=Apatococcus lobatus TaxID=904363 RepID=A0AAW1RHP9_9CHLO
MPLCQGPYLERRMIRQQVCSESCKWNDPVQVSAWQSKCSLKPVRHHQRRAGGRKGCGVASSRDDTNQPDLIERLFSGLFGKNSLSAEEPGGMKRLSKEVYQQQQPATTTEFAALLEGDKDEIRFFRPLLANTSLAQLPLRKAYDAATNGWSASSFHEKVDGFGAAVVWAESAGGALFGGFNPRGWIGLGEDRDSLAAFLFTWPDGNTSKAALKLPKVGGAAMAVMDKEASGPQFGAEGLTIPLRGCEEEARRAKSRLGSYYAKGPDGRRSLFSAADGPKFADLVQLKVFVAEGNGEEWKLDGIVWSSKAT